MLRRSSWFQTKWPEIRTEIVYGGKKKRNRIDLKTLLRLENSKDIHTHICLDIYTYMLGMIRGRKAREKRRERRRLWGVVAIGEGWILWKKELQNTASCPCFNQIDKAVALRSFRVGIALARSIILTSNIWVGKMFRQIFIQILE